MHKLAQIQKALAKLFKNNANFNKEFAKHVERLKNWQQF